MIQSSTEGWWSYASEGMALDVLQFLNADLQAWWLAVLRVRASPELDCFLQRPETLLADRLQRTKLQPSAAALQKVCLW